MDTNSTPYVLGPEEGEAFWGLDNSLWTLKATAEQNGSRFSLIEEVAPKGEGTPLHAHPEDDETFYVLEGELTFYFDNGQPIHHPIRAPAGSFVHIPGGVVHAFKVDSETARYLIPITPQNERFYRYLATPGGPLLRSSAPVL